MLVLDALPERPTLADDERVARFVLHASLETGLDASLQTPPAPPRRLVLALDRSSSMAGARLLQAKRLAAGLLELLPDGLEVALLAYDADVSTLLPPTRLGRATRDQALAALRALDVGYGTRLDAALAHALSLTPRGGHVVLLTDGYPSRGETAIGPLVARTLARGAATLSTLGIGPHSHDLLLDCLARAGGGDAHFVEDLGETDLAHGLGRELALLTHTASAEVDLVLHPARGVTLQKVWYRGPARREGEARVVRLPRLVVGRPLRIALQLAWTTDAPRLLGLAELRARLPDGRERRRELALRVAYGPRAAADPDAFADILLARLLAAIQDAAIDGTRAAPRWLAERVASLRALADQEHVDTPSLRAAFAFAARALEARGPRALARSLTAVEERSLAAPLRDALRSSVLDLRHRTSLVPLDE